MIFAQLLDDLQRSFTSIDLTNVIDLSNVDHALGITILNTDDLYTLTPLTEEPITTTEKTVISTDFVSIANFNVPDPVPLTFPERWAG